MCWYGVMVATDALRASPVMGWGFESLYQHFLEHTTTPALIKVGLSPRGLNYQRAYRLMGR